MDELLAGDAPSPWYTLDDGARICDAMIADSAARAAALPAEQAAFWWTTQGDWRDAEARDHQVMRLRMGIDLLIVEQRPHADTSRRPLVEQAPLLSELAQLAAQAGPASESVALTFLEIVLVDDAGVPIADEPYEVELPDGRVSAGRLDADGFARLDAVPIGPCVVRFPRCHRAEVEAA